MNYNQIQISPFHSASGEERYLLSNGNNFYETGAPLVDLLMALQRNPIENLAIEEYIALSGGKYTHSQIKNVIEKHIAPLFVDKPKKRTFLYERELLDAGKIDSFSDKLSFLFSPVAMTAVFAIGLLLDIYYFATASNLLVFNNSAGLYTIGFLLAFAVFSSFFHELGHAAACKHFGIKHGAIGFGLYLNFPVLYTDVTRVWTLERRQRCVVNIAGVYFQFLLLIPILGVLLLTGNDICRYIVLIMNLGLVMTLNPFFKFDGYWLMTDILGVANLRQRSNELLGYLFAKIRRAEITKTPYLLTLKPVAKIGFLVYSLIVNVFMGYYFLYIIPKFLYGFITEFPHQIQQLVIFTASRVSVPFSLIRNIGSQLLFFALIAYMIWNIVKSLKKKENAQTIK